ncbi:general transcription factor 3C polypeptide 1-like [Oppia nitens]|uniref:general transcription factor 3C polypeptide 1-like n=1 Tax=Oppia nitens TaxID=1686743 RepID=UPI0023DB3CB6|nr:general transcription factor 3C polypeptide 1-like [Oppia nitens]
MMADDNDLMAIILDEIALEGLDGMTLDSLWIRLTARTMATKNKLFDFKSASVHNFIFENIIKHLTNDKTIAMYLLPQTRQTIQLYNRYQHMNEETGTIREDPDLIPDDIYREVTPISDQQIKGSSCDYYHRLNVTKDVLNGNMSIADIIKTYDLRKFVLVANQSQRYKALMGPYSDVDIELTPIQYCILERIGRQRYLGEITIGKESGNYNQSAKTLFYYRKVLLRKKLICKKQIIIFNVKTVQNSHGLVFTLSRFNTGRQTITEINAQKVSDMLVATESKELDYDFVKNQLDIKTRYFRDLMASYSSYFQVYTLENNDGNNSSANNNNNNKRMIHLIRPISSNDDNNCDNEDEEDDEEIPIGTNKQSLIVFNPGKILVDRSLLSQALAIIESHESQDGISLKELGSCLSLPKLEARSLMRYLEKLKVISTVMVDRGRQKVTLYLPKCRSNEAINMFSRARKSLSFSDSNLMTVNLLNRANLILEFVQKSGIVGRIYDLKKLILDSEKDNLHKVCTKSVLNIVHKLAADGLVRSIRTILRYQDQVKKLHFVCVPSITPDHPLVKERINQIKFQWIGKYCTDIQSDKCQANVVSGSLSKFSKNTVVMNLVYQPSIARRYGLEPKLKKMLTLYRFLYYLTYDFQKENIPQTDWRYNIEALPDGLQTKVCTMGEIIPRLPVSIFVKIIWISFIIPGLQELIDDPIVSHQTLSQISPHIRQCLLYRRKFAFNLCEELVGLSYLGLVETQYREQTEKESTIITVKNKVSLTLNNVKTDFEFNTMKDLQEFEETLQMHCYDPCDNCSIDKRLFAHNLRNWTFTPSYKSKGINASNRLQKLSGSTANDINTNVEVIDNKTKTTSAKKRKSKSNTSKQTKKLKTVESDIAITSPVVKEKSLTLPDLTTPTTSPTNKKRFRSYDKIDLRAKSLLKKQRSDWTPEEDSFLLVCKVASTLLDPNCPTHICVNRNVIRDELHTYLPHISKDKTALACQRRIIYMLKNPNTRQNVVDYIGEFNQEMTVTRPDVPKTHENVWRDSYLNILHQILVRMQSLQSYGNNQQTIFNVNSKDELIARFKIIYRTTHLLPVRGPIHEEPNNVVDVHVNVVTNVLLSSLLSKHYLNSDTLNVKNESNLFAQTLFRIYQRYPETLIRSVVTKLGKYGVMTKIKKTIDFSAIKSKGSTPYRISQSFLFLYQTKYYLENLMKGQTLDSDVISIKEGKTGFEAAIVSSLLCSKSGKFYTNIPDNMAVLQKNFPFHKTNIEKTLKDPKTTSRYALHLLRQHINSGQFDRTRHTAEYLSINQCKITCESNKEFLFQNQRFESLFQKQKIVFTKELIANTADSCPNDDQPLLDYIKNKRELGASFDELLSFKTTEHELQETLNRLCDEKIMFRVGICLFKWVSVEYVNPWLVHSQVSQTTGKTSSNKSHKKLIKFFARYWKQPNGMVDNKVVFKLLSGILGHIITNPCISQQKLIDFYNQALQPVQLLEIIELLSEAQCIECIESDVIMKPKLFESKVNLINNMKATHYLATDQCLIKLCQLKQFLNI